MALHASKLTNTQIKVIETADPVETELVYDITQLQAQKRTIQALKDRDNALRDAALARVQMLLDKCDELGITAPIDKESADGKRLP